MLALGLLLAAPVFSTTPDDDKQTGQTLTVNDEKVERVVSEIQLDGNNAILLFTDGGQMTADMRLVTITMSYEDATEVREVKGVNGVKEVKDNSYYTLDGVKLTVKPKQKGLYIQNGKKVVNKK